MTIQVKFYGDLKKKTPGQDKGAGIPKIFHIEKEEINMISDILNKYSIDESEIFHVFVNGKYSGPKKKVEDGDKVAIFPRNMSLLYKWYFDREG